MNYDEDIYEKILNNISLLCEITKQNTVENHQKVDLKKIEEIINHKMPDILKKNAPENFYELYVDFKSEYEKFKDFILYDKLIGKNIVALGGGFSSGKSSFLNTLMGKTVLPAATDPSTSVPIYIVGGEEHDVTGINVFDAKVRMKPSDIKKIAHGFGEVYTEDCDKVMDEITLGHVLENLFFSTPLHKFENIAFLDTPGYSKPDSEKYSVKTDEKIARSQLNSSNYILWFVQADAGTITDEDIKFIKTIRADIPKLIILNKADKKNIDDLRIIIEKVKSNLDIKGVKYVDVLPFTSCNEQIGDEKLKEYILNGTNKIKNQIENWNRQVYESSFAINFKRLFVDCKSFYDEEIDEESKKLARLNTSITKLMAEDIDAETLEPLTYMVRDAQKSVNELKSISDKLKELQQEFFTEIKFISDIVGIAMPEPTEIDLLQEKSVNPMKILDNYIKSKGIKADSNVTELLSNIFENITPVINKAVGGTEYSAEIINCIQKNCKVALKDNRINDVIKNATEYKTIIAGGVLE